MAQIILALLAIAAAVVALKVVVGLLILAGLIFRTRETISVLVVLGAFALLGRYPVAGYTLLAVVAFVSIKRALNKDDRDKLPDKPSG